MTQRKFLRSTSGFADAMNTRPYPRLFALDYIAKGETSAQQRARIELAAAMAQERGDASTAQEREEREEKKREEEERKKKEDEEKKKEEEKDREEVKRQDSEEESKPKKVEKILGIRVLCENEENWHPTGNPFEITDKMVLQNSSPYLSRIMLLLKQSDLSLAYITSEEGEDNLNKLTEVSRTTLSLASIEFCSFRWQQR